MNYSDKVFVRIEVTVVPSSIMRDVVQFELVAEESSDTAEALAELESIRGLVSDKLDVDSELLVVKTEPVSKLLRGYNFAVDAGLSILEVLSVLFLLGIQQENFGLLFHWVLDLVPHDFNLLEQEHGFEGS